MADKINLLVVDDEEALRNLLVERFSRQEFNVTGCATGEEALAAAGRQQFDVGIIDIRMPGIGGIEIFKTIRQSQPNFEAVILTGQATIDSAIEAMKLGAYDYLAKPCKLYELEIIVRKAYEKKMLAQENLRLKGRLTLADKKYDFAGDSPRAAEIREIIAKVAQSNVPVLITGEPGSGKEFVARAIHQAGRAEDAPFITVTCSAIPHGLLESQLFGHEEGAFMGSVGKKEGWADMAHGGTLYFEEVEDLHPSSQVKLLRLIETGAFQRVGGNADIVCSARIIASTERDLRELVLKRSFREDLFYRLGTVTIPLPPLRDRKEDIPALITQMMEGMGPGAAGKIFSGKAINAMLKYDWPGNMRELLNVVERTALLSAKKTIQARDIPLSLDKKGKGNKLRHLMSLAEVEREHILYVLTASNGNISRASRVLGVSRPKLYRKIEQYKAGQLDVAEE